MAGLDPAIHVLATSAGDASYRVDAWVEPAHDGVRLVLLKLQQPFPVLGPPCGNQGFGLARKRVAAAAGVAIAAIAPMPPDPDPLAMAPSGHTRPNRVHNANDLVAGHPRIGDVGKQPQVESRAAPIGTSSKANLFGRSTS
jgi:hypothetical protein